MCVVLPTDVKSIRNYIEHHVGLWVEILQERYKKYSNEYSDARVKIRLIAHRSVHAHNSCPAIGLTSLYTALSMLMTSDQP